MPRCRPASPSRSKTRPRRAITPLADDQCAGDQRFAGERDVPASGRHRCGRCRLAASARTPATGRSPPARPTRSTPATRSPAAPPTHAGNSDQIQGQCQLRLQRLLPPVDNAAVNTVKAGSAIPVKFSLGGNQGLAIFAADSPASGRHRAVRRLGDRRGRGHGDRRQQQPQLRRRRDQYNYVWKTEKTWVGCRQLRMKFKDGSVRTANFKFR